MKYFPYENYCLSTDLPPEVVLTRLRQEVEPFQLRFWPVPELEDIRSFQGTIEGDCFKVHLTLAHKNAFRPQIIGKVNKSPTGSRIHIVMRMSYFFFCFWIVWLSAIGIMTIKFGLQIESWKAIPLLLIPLSMFLLGYLIGLYGFKSESSRAKRALAEVLEAMETPIQVRMESTHS